MNSVDIKNNIKEKLKELPKKPGCYLMKNANGEIIYVGKAKILANRVKSYFVGSHDAKTTKMVSMVNDFEYIITGSETEAFILEMNLIKKHHPKYNIMLMDDKRYPYICISNEKNPRIYYTRDLNKKAKYYGPYPNALAAKEVVELLNKIYPLRKCYKIPKKECLYYHLGQCLAPCINDIKEEEYEAITNKINHFLKGNVTDEIKRLKSLMYEASDNLEFEKAKEYLNIIKSLEIISEKQKMEVEMLDTDIFGYVEKDGYISIQVFHIRSNKMVERNGFLFEVMEDASEMFVDFLGQFYFVYNNPLPKEIILPDVDVSFVDERIKNKIYFPKKGKKKELVDLVTENAKEKVDVLLKRENNKYERTLGAIKELEKILNIASIHIIEAFDNSNIQGTSSVSAMVSYVDGVKNPKGYRKFKVKTVTGSDDVKTMYEVIIRRYSRLKNENKVMPDLILIDGGHGQVEASREALKKLDLNIPLLGMVKDTNHHSDHLLYQDEEIFLDKKSKVFLLLENIQDEVHRYAISFHHQLHGKNTFASSLDKIKGIGPIKKQKVLSILGSYNFAEELKKINLSEEQQKEILKIYNPS